MQKQIGSNSKYGAIYITSIDKAVGKYPIASKLMEINRSNSVEKCLNEHITTKIMKKNYPGILYLHTELLYAIIYRLMFLQLLKTLIILLILTN